MKEPPGKACGFPCMVQAQPHEVPRKILLLTSCFGVAILKCLISEQKPHIFILFWTLEYILDRKSGSSKSEVPLELRQG
jgi:hypothetical protein